MTRDAVLTWLVSRQPPAPEELQSAIAAVVRDAPEACVRLSVSESLAAIATHVLEEALDVSATSRNATVKLLVADSLVTYALEAQSEQSQFAQLGPFAAAITG